MASVRRARLSHSANRSTEVNSFTQEQPHGLLIVERSSSSGLRARHANQTGFSDKGSILPKLRRITALQFEHLIYDLLVLSGLRNPIWRTPGPDSGRDIEGEVLAFDISESANLQRWYVECKRYSKSVDWPTAYSKIPYAINHGADFLLFVTTGHMSPRCREEISRHNASRLRPVIRVWDGPALEHIVRRHPLLLVKYDLTRAPEHFSTSVLPLVQVAAKAIQACYGQAALAGSPDAALESAAALVDLVAARLAESQILPRKPQPRFRQHTDCYPWCEIGPNVDLRSFDGYALRALLSVLRFFTRSSTVSIRALQANRYEIVPTQSIKSQALDAVLPTLQVWSNFTTHGFSDGRIVISAKEGSDIG